MIMKSKSKIKNETQWLQNASFGRERGLVTSSKGKFRMGERKRRRMRSSRRKRFIKDAVRKKMEFSIARDKGRNHSLLSVSLFSGAIY